MLMSSVGVILCSGLVSYGLLISEAGVKIAGTGRVGSRPAGYDRGSALLILKRDEADEEIEAASLLPVEVEKVDASDRRDRHDEPEDEVELVAVVFVEAKDEMELRPLCSQLSVARGGGYNLRDSRVCENILWIICGGCLANRASICRIESSGMSTWSSILAKNPDD